MADNLAPQILNLPASASGPHDAANSFQVIANDHNPGDALTWSLGDVTCSFLPVVDASGLVSWACGGVESCTAEVRVADDGSPVLQASGELTIGCGKNFLPGSHWSGLIDDVRIYDRAVKP